MHAKARSIMFFRRACELGNAQVPSPIGPPDFHLLGCLLLVTE